MSRYRDPKATPKFHEIASDYAETFYCQSARVPLAEFAANCVQDEEAGGRWDGGCREVTVDNVTSEAVLIRVAFRMDARVEWACSLWPAEPGDRGSFIAWAWPKPEGYPTVEDCDA